MKLDIEKLKAGIEPYKEEREIIELFLIKPKSQGEFDQEFMKYPTGRVRKGGLPGSGFLLGDWMESYGHHSWWIDLMQYMAKAGYVIVTTIEGVRYFQTND